MRFFYDTEFIEDGKTIDLVSVGMIAENGDTYYAISTEFNARKASQWVKDNVLVHLPERNPTPVGHGGSPRLWEESFAWKPRGQIGEELRQFVHSFPPPYEFWGYYSAYDHVALCQLFGTMMDLPPGWPFYTRDLKQWADEVGVDLSKEVAQQDEHHALADARWNRKAWCFLDTCRVLATTA